MGDVIHTLPAVHALREAFPEAHIGWLIEERWAELLYAPGSPRRGPRSALRPLVDEVHAVNLKAWGKSPFSIATAAAGRRLFGMMFGFAYDAVVDLQGALRSAVLARSSGARVVYGAAEPRESPASLWYTRKVVARGRHVVEQNHSVARALLEQTEEIPPPDISCDFPHDPQAETRIGQRLAEYGLDDLRFLTLGRAGVRSDGLPSVMAK